MRAEILRFTEDLLKIVESSPDLDLVNAEVNNLIATRVEPVIRDADRRANELLQDKWSKLLAGAAKAFGFAGAGFLDPELLAKAVQQTLETDALALSPVEDGGVSMSETAQFVLRARCLVVQRDKGQRLRVIHRKRKRSNEAQPLASPVADRYLGCCTERAHLHCVPGNGQEVEARFPVSCRPTEP
jgi:hypothetical protein